MKIRRVGRRVRADIRDRKEGGEIGIFGVGVCKSRVVVSQPCGLQVVELGWRFLFWRELQAQAPFIQLKLISQQQQPRKMRPPRCLSSTLTASALHRVFVAPIDLQFHPHQLQLRHHAGAALTKPEKSRLPRNDEITAYSITLVLPDGTLSDLRPTSSVLASLNPKTHILSTVVDGSPGTPPICKILNKASLYAAEKAQKQKRKDNKVVSKSLEMNWAIDKGDLGTKMGRLAEWLGKGWRVEVVLAKKRKGRVAEGGEARGVVEAVRGVVEGNGGREWKPIEGSVGGMMTIYCEGKRRKGGEEQEKEKEGEKEGVVGNDTDAVKEVDTVEDVKEVGAASG